MYSSRKSAVIVIGLMAWSTPRSTYAWHHEKKMGKNHSHLNLVLPSESIGSPTRGMLLRGVAVVDDASLEMAPPYEKTQVRYGLPELVALLERVSKAVAKKYPGSVLKVGQLSAQYGGDIERHVSHESGRDVDVQFYVKTRPGIQEPSHFESQKNWPSFRSDGLSEEAPQVQFDDSKNWYLVERLLLDSKVHVSHIFVAAGLKRRLLDYARRSGASARLLSLAKTNLKQPLHSQAHDDHFHIRISCPLSMKRCIEHPEKGDFINVKGRKKTRPSHVARSNSDKTPTRNVGQPSVLLPVAQKSKEEDPLLKLLEPKIEGRGSIILRAENK